VALDFCTSADNQFSTKAKTMRTTSTKENEGTITGVFRTRDDAEKAYNLLLSRGYTSDEIILLMSDKTHQEQFKDSERKTEMGSKAAEKAGVGSAIGGTTGAVVGAIAAIGTAVAIPGLGLVVAGPIVAGLAGAGAGGIAGGLIGALVGSGIPKEDAETYQGALSTGGIVVGVVPKSEDEGILIGEEWKRYGENVRGIDY
jgi:hypothetical protein